MANGTSGLSGLRRSRLRGRWGSSLRRRTGGSLLHLGSPVIVKLGHALRIMRLVRLGRRCLMKLLCRLDNVTIMRLSRDSRCCA